MKMIKALKYTTATITGLGLFGIIVSVLLASTGVFTINQAIISVILSFILACVTMYLYVAIEEYEKERQ